MSKKKLYVLVIPVIFLLAGLVFSRAKFSNDPEYVNLLNGLNIATMHSSEHTVEPGTTIQIFSALASRAIHLFDINEKKDLQTHVLQNPEIFISAIIYIMIFIVALTIWLSGYFVLKYSHNIWFSLSVQLGLPLSSLSVENIWTKISSDSFNTVAALLLMILIIKFLFNNKDNRVLFPVLFGIIIGFGTACSFTFLPLLVLPLLLLRNYRHYFIYIISLVVTFILFTIPATTNYSKMFESFFSLPVGSEKLTAGTTIVIIYFQNFFAFFKNNLIILISLILSFSLLFGLVTQKSLISWAKEYKSIKIFMYLLITLFSEAIFLPLIRNNQTGDIILTLLSILIIIIVVVILFDVLNEKYKNRITGFDWYLFALLAVLVVFSSFKLYRADKGYKSTNNEYREIENLLDKNYKSYIKTYYYPTSINKLSGLKLGNTQSGKYYSNLLAEVYPGALFFDVRNQSFFNWENEYPLSVLISDSSNNKVLIIGGPLSKEDLAKSQSGGLEFIVKYRGVTQAIYELDTNALFKLGIGIKPVWSLCFDAESTTADKKYFTAGNFKIENNWHQSTDVAHTGNYSMKLANENIYACTFYLDSAQANTKYRVSVWCKNRSEQTYLVASSTKVPSFYKQIAKPTLKAKNGWEKIVMEFDVNKDMAGKDIKIYFWKNNRETIYLDDFTIARLK